MPQFEIANLQPWIDYRFDPARGPGGQHVNKVSTRATLLFDFEACDLLSVPQRARIRQRLVNRISADGRLRVVAQRSRSQSDNRSLAEQRLLELLSEALHVARRRRPTKPTRGSQQRRIQEKKQRGETKRRRQSRPRLDD